MSMSEGATLCVSCGSPLQRGKCDRCADGTRVERRPADDLTRVHPFSRGDVVDGRFVLKDELARGAMGIVYRAHDRVRGADAALKVLSPDYCRTPDYVERFEREAEVLGGLSHPNIVQVLAIGRRGALPWIAMPFLEGETLETLSDRDAPLPPSLVWDILRQAGEALIFVHAHALVHRDVKPSNIFVGQDGTCTLIDFGVVRDLGATLRTRPGLRIGTPAYMAPEQIKGEPVDHRADIYALGAIAFELLVGRPPFQHDDPQLVIRCHLVERPPAPTSLSKALPPELDAVLLKALEKAPARRFQTVTELLVRLSAVIGDGPTVVWGDPELTQPAAGRRPEAAAAPPPLPGRTRRS